MFALLNTIKAINEIKNVAPGWPSFAAFFGILCFLEILFKYELHTDEIHICIYNIYIHNIFRSYQQNNGYLNKKSRVQLEKNGKKIIDWRPGDTWI